MNTRNKSPHNTFKRLIPAAVAAGIIGLTACSPAADRNRETELSPPPSNSDIVQKAGSKLIEIAVDDLQVNQSAWQPDTDFVYYNYSRESAGENDGRVDIRISLAKEQFDHKPALSELRPEQVTMFEAGYKQEQTQSGQPAFTHLHITSLGLDSWQAYRHCRADGGEPQTGFFSNNLNDEAAVTPEQFGVAVNEAFANEQAVLDGAVPAYVVSCS